MRSQPLVSIVVPCYNVENKIMPLLNSILRQTYKNLELIFVNDGSIDNTKKIIFSYREKYEQQGMSFKYIEQVNAGPGAACGRGMQEVTGEFLIWPDADDWLSDDSIEKKLFYLLDNPDCSCVTSDAAIYKAEDLTKQIGKLSDGRDYLYDENQFELILKYKTIFCPGCHMIRMSDFLEVNPQRYIFPSRSGQNIQMLLPISYMRKKQYIDKCLYHYVIYNDSVSRKDYKDKETSYNTYDNLFEIYKNTLDHISMTSEERMHYLKLVELETLKQKYFCSYNYIDSKTEKILYKKLKQEKAIDNEIKKIHRRSNLNVLRIVLRKIKSWNS